MSNVHKNISLTSKFDRLGCIQDRYVTNDPLGQTHSHASSEHCFLLFCFSRFKKWGRTYGQHMRKLWSLPAVTLGWPSGSKIASKTMRNARKDVRKKITKSDCGFLRRLLCHFRVTNDVLSTPPSLPTSGYNNKFGISFWVSLKIKDGNNN